jgi:hypothetical protein
MFCNSEENLPLALQPRSNSKTSVASDTRLAVTEAARGGVSSSALVVAASVGGLENAASPRTSEILRGILTKNPAVKTFSIERILAAIGSDRLEVSLMMFSLPAIVPVPGPRGLVTMPTGALAYQLVSGQKQLRLPRFILKKCVSRRALAVALHAVLPVLEAAEKILRPRWSWVGHSSARRAIGLFVFVLAVAIAYPLFGFTTLHATSIFVMALGMAEQDGLAVMIGVAVGLLSLTVLAASGMSARALRAKAGKWLRRIGKRLGLRVFARYLRSRGYGKLAHVLSLQWSDVLLMWDPEGRGRRRVASKVVATGGQRGPQRLAGQAQAA